MKMRVPKVRWDTEYEEADCDELMAGSDDFAIWLDRNGWQIVMKPECFDEDHAENCKWRMYAPSDACPEWAIEIEPTRARRKITYEPYPDIRLKH
jgi:hypothetical protein